MQPLHTSLCGYKISYDRNSQEKESLASLPNNVTALVQVSHHMRLLDMRYLKSKNYYGVDQDNAMLKDNITCWIPEDILLQLLCMIYSEFKVLNKR